MTRTKKILLFAVMIAFTAVCLFATFTAAYAEETTPPEQVTEEPQNEPQIDDETVTEPPTTETTEETTEEPGEGTDDTAFDMAALVEKFTAYLKDKYGAEYGQIYNGIIEQWGSIEAYLLQFGEEYIPEEYNAGWGDFVEWLGVNAPIWATALALACVIFIAVFGKKAFDKMVKKIVDTKVNVLSAELNKQSAAISAQMKALKTIMPTTEKGAAVVQELDEKEKELTQ